VIIPTHRRPLELQRCLEAVVALDIAPERYEIIVVNDGGSDDTEQCVAAVAAVTDRQLRSVRQAQSGPARARNTGAAEARGQLLAFTDDDCAPRSDWLNRLEARLIAHPSAIVGGRSINALSTLPCSVASQELIDFLYEYFRRGDMSTGFFTTNNLAVTARTFRDSGGFDVSFPLAAGEDREFCERWRCRGGALIYAEDALVDHAHRLTFGRFLRQHFTYGRGADFLRRSRARRGDADYQAPTEPWSFHLRLVTFPLRQGPSWRALTLCVLLAMSQVTYVAGYFFQRVFRLNRPQPRSA
jgi:glycosyltransferase involved in cell wall biosynthesis